MVRFLTGLLVIAVVIRNPFYGFEWIVAGATGRSSRKEGMGLTRVSAVGGQSSAVPQGPATAGGPRLGRTLLRRPLYSRAPN
jgi:hypothetical protein